MDISCTAVRVPTLRAHAEALTIETHLDISPDEARWALIFCCFCVFGWVGRRGCRVARVDCRTRSWVRFGRSRERGSSSLPPSSHTDILKVVSVCRSSKSTPLPLCTHTHTTHHTPSLHQHMYIGRSWQRPPAWSCGTSLRRTRTPCRSPPRPSTTSRCVFRFGVLGLLLGFVITCVWGRWVESKPTGPTNAKPQTRPYFDE